VIRWPSLLIYPLIICLSLTAQEVTIEVSVESSTEGIDRPLSGMITIAHNNQSKIDTDSFTLDSKLLPVDLIKRVAVGTGNQKAALSIYHFELPSEKPGKYSLNKIYVTIDGQIHHSNETDYELEEPKIGATPLEGIIFQLEATVKKPSLFYPGQRAQFIYTLFYNQNIELTLSELPLLDPEGFLKIGEKEIHDAQNGELTAQEITQEVEAIKPGTYSFKRSLMEGYAYSENFIGHKIYQGSKKQAEAPAVTIEVLAFPKLGKPLSFSGIVGDLEMDLKMITPSSIKLGESIQLELKIRSLNDLDELKLPEIYCQPGFSGFFTIDPIKLTEVTKNSRSFLIDLTPQTTLIKEIPPIEIATFDPSTSKYSIWQSAPIPVKIESKLAVEGSFGNYKPLDEAALALLSDQFKNQPPAPLELRSPIHLRESDLQVSWMKSPKVLYFIPLAALLLMLQQIGYKKWQEYLQKHQKKSGRHLFNEALDEKNDYRAAQLLRRSLENYAELDQAKKIIEQLDRFQYGLKEKIHIDHLKSKCKSFFDQVL
jgi:hypothetical protein